MTRRWPPYTPGLVILVLAGLWLLLLLSAPSRAQLAAAQAEARDLRRQETALIERAAALASGRSPQAGAAAWPDGFIWEGADPTALEIAFQSALLDAAKAAGLRVTSFGPSAGPKGLTQKTLGFELELEGDHAPLADFLAKAEAHRPRLAYQSLWLRHRAGGGEVGKALLTARIGFWGFVAAAPGVGMEGGGG